MQIENLKTESFQISGAAALDPINVILQDAAPGKGQIIITCYGQAWTSYWGAMGDRTIRQFVQQCDPDYLLNNMVRSLSRQKKKDQAYLHRIILAVKQALEKSPPSSDIPKFQYDIVKEALNAGMQCAEKCPLNTTYHERVMKEALAHIDTLPS